MAPGTSAARAANLTPSADPWPAGLTTIGNDRRSSIAGSALAAPSSSKAAWTQPNGGLFIWARLPDYIDTTDLLARALRENVAFVPGRAATLRVEVGALYDEVTRRVNHQTHLEQAIAEHDAELERRGEQIARQERRHDQILGSRRYRLGRALSRPLEALRQRG